MVRTTPTADGVSEESGTITAKKPLQADP